jgi:hypothetical protein
VGGASGRGTAAIAIGLLALILPVAGLIAWLSVDRPDPLSDYHLAGARTARGTVCLDIAADFSTSMDDDAQVRNDALEQLEPFMASQLRPGDLLAMTRFASTAVLSLPPTRIDRLLASAEEPARPVQRQYTYFAPALREALRAHDGGGPECAVHSLIAITDGEFADAPAALAPLIKKFHRVYWAIPDEDRNFRPMTAADPAVAAVVTHGFHDANELGVLYGEVLADATGQKLTQQHD